MCRLSLDDPVADPVGRRSPQVLSRQRFFESFEDAQPWEKMFRFKSVHASWTGQKRSQAHAGFFALSLHNARRISFWVHDKSHVGAMVNNPGGAFRLLIAGKSSAGPLVESTVSMVETDVPRRHRRLIPVGGRTWQRMIPLNLLRHPIVLG